MFVGFVFMFFSVNPCDVAAAFGPGYRVYFGRESRKLVVLLGGGSKRRQDADIAAAIERWKRYKQGLIWH